MGPTPARRDAYRRNISAEKEALTHKIHTC
jgi:hypothetical protein